MQSWGMLRSGCACNRLQQVACSRGVANQAPHIAVQAQKLTSASNTETSAVKPSGASPVNIASLTKIGQAPPKLLVLPV